MPAWTRERGLPIADYFLWNDDFEFTTRLIRGERGRCTVPARSWSTRPRRSARPTPIPATRFYYEVRNKVWLFPRSRGLSPAEKALYGGSTLRRWAAPFAPSSDRPHPASCGLGAGLRTGVLSGPRPTATCSATAAGTGARPRWLRTFSLLMSVWGGDDPGFLDAAFRSGVHDQTRRPDEVVLVQDGPVPPPLAAVHRAS